MFDRAGINGGDQFARTYLRMAGGQLFRILGKNPSRRRAASSRYSQPFAIRKYLLLKVFSKFCYMIKNFMHINVKYSHNNFLIK